MHCIWRDLLENYSSMAHSLNQYELTIYYVDTASDLTKFVV